MRLSLASIGSRLPSDARREPMLLWLIRVYQLSLSPWLGPIAAFIPAAPAMPIPRFERYGALQGAWLGLRRLYASSLAQGGYDQCR